MAGVSTDAPLSWMVMEMLGLRSISFNCQSLSKLVFVIGLPPISVYPLSGTQKKTIIPHVIVIPVMAAHSALTWEAIVCLYACMLVRWSYIQCVYRGVCRALDFCSAVFGESNWRKRADWLSDMSAALRTRVCVTSQIAPQPPAKIQHSSEVPCIVIQLVCCGLWNQSKGGANIDLASIAALLFKSNYRKNLLNTSFKHFEFALWTF